MNTIHLYCKANKRKRNDKTVGVYAYIVQEASSSEEKVIRIEGESRVAKLELMALVAGLQNLVDANRLVASKQLHLYVTNEYILEELQKGIKAHATGKALSFSKGTEYTELWEVLESILSKMPKYRVTGLNKKDRGEDDDIIKGNMGLLNKLACDEINHYFRESKEAESAFLVTQ